MRVCSDKLIADVHLLSEVLNVVKEVMMSVIIHPMLFLVLLTTVFVLSTLSQGRTTLGDSSSQT